MSEFAKIKRSTQNTNEKAKELLMRFLENLACEKAGVSPRYDEQELLTSLQLLRNEQIELLSEVSAETAAKSPTLFEEWNGRAYREGERVNESGTVYMAKQDIDHNQTWRPSLTPTLWEPLAGSGEAGTLSNPITAAVGMAYVAGKYYSENEVLYLCSRQGAKDGDEFTLYYLPSQLIGHYFEKVTE